MDAAFIRYLAAKQSLDDRSINRPVWGALTQALAARPPDRPLRVLEIGAGAGAMVERAWRWGLPGGEVRYTAVDVAPNGLAEARRRLLALGAEDTGSALRLSDAARQMTVELVAADAFDFAATAGAQRWGLLIGCAFLDLVDVPRALGALLKLLAPGGLAYFPITYDGLTAFEPIIDASLDERIMARYHATMDSRRVAGQPSGDSQTGRHLFAHLRAAGAEVVAAGASDWVVHVGPGGYPADEAYLLHHILHTIEGALRGSPGLAPAELTGWLAARHAQAERGELVYIAHQLDVLARRQGTSPPR